MRFQHWLIGAMALMLWNCSGGSGNNGNPNNPNNPGSGTEDPTSAAPSADPANPNFSILLVPQSGVSGAQRVNFAIPIRQGLLQDADQIRLSQSGTELPAIRRGLARYPDNSWRSVQVQTDLSISGDTLIEVSVGTAPQSADLASFQSVEDTLVNIDGTQGPRVWVLVPSRWLADSGIAGIALAREDFAGDALLNAWNGVCNYEEWNTAAFLAIDDEQGSWLFDRPTAMYRGYVITGQQGPLASAYKEVSMYRNGIENKGGMEIGDPLPEDDLKYYYSQGLAIHYLLTGDDRFREAAENIAIQAHSLWSNPGYAGSDDFWTERHAGFGLLAYEWAARVSDDQASTFATWAQQAVDAYLAMQASFPSGTPASWYDSDTRCFSHTANAHGEGFGTIGCSPWMSAILADALESYAIRTGGTEADRARQSIIRLGRAIAFHGRDSSGKPFYWMATGQGQNGEVDDFDEHWGESAYIAAMAWHYSGRSDTALKQATDELIAGLRDHGEAGQLRSFNWQCRSGPLAPAYLH